MYRYYIIGFNILWICHISYSFVLLTANVEDVKKLARKFVSESLAEQIAAFVVKVTDQVVNASAENKNAIADHEFNDEEIDKFRGASRNRFETVPGRSKKSGKRPKKDDKLEHFTNDRVKDVDDRLNVFHDRIKTTRARLLKKASKSQPNNWTKYKASVAKNGLEGEGITSYWLDGKIKENQVQSNRIAKQYSYALNAPRRPGHASMGDKSLQYLDVQKPQHTSTDGATIKSTLGYAEKFLLDDNLSSDRERKKSEPFALNPHGLASANPGDIEEENNEVNKTISIIDMFQSKFNQFVNVQRATDLTTKKERIEFDQYDNPFYPKRNFVATSGPVALPKLPVEKPENPWWTRSMPLEPHKKSKVWF